MPLTSMEAFVTGGEVVAPPVALAPAVSAPAEAPPESAAPAPSTLEVVAEPVAPQAPVVSLKSARPSKPQPAPKANGRRLETRQDGTTLRKVTLYLDPALDRRLAMQSVSDGIDRSQLVAEALERFLRRFEG